MGMMEAYCRIGNELLSADFIDSPTRAEPERIFIALSNAEDALDMLASTVERFELMFVPFAKLAAERIRGNDDCRFGNSSAGDSGQSFAPECSAALGYAQSRSSTWAAAKSRTFELRLEPETLMAVAGVAGRIVITVYAPERINASPTTPKRKRTAQAHEPSGPPGDGRRRTMAPRQRTGRTSRTNR